MTWTISHAPYGETLSRSTSSMNTLARHASHVLPSKDWRAVRHFFDQVLRTSSPFDVAWQQAGPIANALHLTACSARTPETVAQLAEALAAAADNAAKNRQSWRWSS